MEGFKVIRRSDLVATEWSGGSLTQLYIHPDPSRYEDRDFLFHIATATVELEESTFSDLTGYTRIIMTLDHPLELIHNGSLPVRLNKFEPHVFDGGAKTVSRGRVTDFNLVLKTGACSGELKALTLPPGRRWPFGGRDRVMEVIYCFRGEGVFQGTPEAALRPGDLAVLDHGLMDRVGDFLNNGSGDCELIVSTVALPE